MRDLTAELNKVLPDNWPVDEKPEFSKIEFDDESDTLFIEIDFEYEDEQLKFQYTVLTANLISEGDWAETAAGSIMKSAFEKSREFLHWRVSNVD